LKNRDHPQSCPLCGGTTIDDVEVPSFLLPARSYAPALVDHANFICGDCGIVFAHPWPDEAALADYYNSAYRANPDALIINDITVDAPVSTSANVKSLKRARTFAQTVERAAERRPDARPNADDLVVDFGSYQGLFPYALSRVWGCRGIAVDYSRDGIDYARALLGLTESRVTRDLYSETFSPRPRFATFVHSFEHLKEPARMLEHLKSEVLAAGGYLYIEVPNLYGTPLSDPTHFFTYTDDSLGRLLTQHGFEVVEMWHSGFPPVMSFDARNDEQNVVCLARLTEHGNASSQPSPVDVMAIRRRLRRSYRRHSIAAVRRQFAAALRGAARAFYNLTFGVILEGVSPRLMQGVARRLKLRR
jgi:hypothetical protein